MEPITKYRKTHEEFINLLKNFDFVNFGIASFVRAHGSCDKTIKKYLIKHNIPYNTKIPPEKPFQRCRKTGRFVSSFFESPEEYSTRKTQEHILNNFSNDFVKLDIKPKQEKQQKIIENPVYQKKLKPVPKDYSQRKNETQYEYSNRINKIMGQTTEYETDYDS